LLNYYFCELNKDWANQLLFNGLKNYQEEEKADLSHLEMEIKDYFMCGP
jgi:hypothetical protein